MGPQTLQTVLNLKMADGSTTLCAFLCAQAAAPKQGWEYEALSAIINGGQANDLLTGLPVLENVVNYLNDVNAGDLPCLVIS